MLLEGDEGALALPRAARRPAASPPAKWCAHEQRPTHWKQRPEGGGRFAIWLIRNIARHGGRAIARLCLYPIVLYFFALRGPERRASRTYLTRVLRKPATLFGVWRHIHTFAATILDRVFLLGEDLRRFDVRVHGLEDLHATVDAHGGVLLFGSHLGSFEVLRVLARERPDIPVRVVLDKAHNPAMTQLLDALNPEVAATVIDAGQDGPSIVLAIQHAIAEGALVALLVDRAQPGEPGLPVEFLGAPSAVPARALADRRGAEGAGGARLRPVPRRQPLRPDVRTVQRPYRGPAPGSQPRAGRHGPPLCRATGAPCPQRALQLVQLLRFLASADRSPRR